MNKKINTPRYLSILIFKVITNMAPIKVVNDKIPSKKGSDLEAIKANELMDLPTFLTYIPYMNLVIIAIDIIIKDQMA